MGEVRYRAGKFKAEGEQFIRENTFYYLVKEMVRQCREE
jgi:hypothetical protein